jgi:hypothetical protein
MGSLSWSARRSIKLSIVRLILLLVGGALAFILKDLPAPPWLEAAEALPTAPGATAQSLGWFVLFLYIPVLDNVLAWYPDIGIFLSGAITFGLPLWLFSGSLVDSFLASFNDEVLTRIARDPNAVDKNGSPRVWLPWVDVEGNDARRRAWESLDSWARSETGTGGSILPGAAKFKRLSVAALVGRAGSGKSRMAGQFARHLARRDKLGGDRRVVAPLWRLGVQLRATVWFLKRRPDDPWDCGVLRHRSPETRADYSKRLLEWRPRRPTLLILDDPVSGEETKIRDGLARDTKNAFAHPVRLLVVGQTISTDSGYSYSPGNSMRDNRWLYDQEDAKPPPIQLPEPAWFEPAEARWAASHSGALAGQPNAIMKSMRDDLWPVTKGNPLLVELAVDWLATRGVLKGVTAAMLHAHRVERIIAALEIAGIKEKSQRLQLALATLVGGAERDTLKREAERVWGSAMDLPDRDKLQRCFPADEPTKPGGALWIPAMRPELIGDAFIDDILRLTA